MVNALIYAVQLVGVFIVMFGIACLVSRPWLEAVIEYISQGKRILSAAFMRILVGLLFLAAYDHCRYPQIILVVGWASFITGIAFLGMGPDRTRRLLLKWAKLTPKMHIFWAVSAIAAGIFIYLSA